jgi:N-acetylglutamate synthase-like GNAT family acetyltransferase
LSAQATVRQAKPQDKEAIREIIRLSFPWFGVFARHSVDDEEGKVLVADYEGKVVAFAKLIEFSIAAAKYGCILRIGVHPSLRKKGIALVLTNAGVDELKTCGSQAVFASTQRRNIGARATLHRAGFKSIGLVGLWRLFGWRVFSFFGAIWLAPGEVVLLHA